MAKPVFNKRPNNIYIMLPKSNTLTYTDKSPTGPSTQLPPSLKYSKQASLNRDRCSKTKNMNDNLWENTISENCISNRSDGFDLI